MDGENQIMAIWKRKYSKIAQNTLAEMEMYIHQPTILYMYTRKSRKFIILLQSAVMILMTSIKHITMTLGKTASLPQLIVIRTPRMLFNYLSLHLKLNSQITELNILILNAIDNTPMIFLSLSTGRVVAY